MAKEVYYIKYGKANSLIKSPQKATQFSFVDTEEDETIFEGRIGDFLCFESQIKAQLEAVGFQKEGFFKKNIACVAIPIDTTPIDKKNIFDCCDQVGFSEVYLVYEHIALAIALKYSFPGIKTFGIIDAGCSKVDISVVQDPSRLNKSSFKLGKERYAKYLYDPMLSELLFKLIAFDAKLVFEDFLPTQSSQLILTGGRMNQTEFIEGFLNEFEFKNLAIRIDNNDELVISGLESIWKSESQKLKTNSFIQKMKT